MAHYDLIIDTDKCFEIDPITRSIRNESKAKTTVIQFDHNSERFTFTLPRIIEGHDMTECNKVEVHYLNGATPGVYEVDDLKISDADEKKVTCSWLISQNATQNTGALHFLIRFSCVDADGTIKYVWNTDIFKGINVTTGMFNAAAIVEQYADVLEQWKKELFGSGNTLEEAKAYTDEKIEGVQATITEMEGNIVAEIQQTDMHLSSVNDDLNDLKSETNATFSEVQSSLNYILESLNTGLDNILAIQNNLIGGDAE